MIFKSPETVLIFLIPLMIATILRSLLEVALEEKHKTNTEALVTLINNFPLTSTAQNSYFHETKASR